jgi:hypothetical protein
MSEHGHLNDGLDGLFRASGRAAVVFAMAPLSLFFVLIPDESSL